MKSISFKNFRKYGDFPEMSLGRLNIFVGQNNSGKSTTIKAMLLALINADRTRVEDPQPSFSFINSLDAHTHLGDLQQNKHDILESPSFSIKIGDSVMSFELEKVSKNNKDHIFFSVPLYKLVLDFPKYCARIVHDSVYEFSFSLAGLQAFYDDLPVYCDEFAPSVRALLWDLQQRSTKETITVTIIVNELHDYTILNGPDLSAHGREGLLFFVERMLYAADKDFHSYRIEFIEAHSASHNELLNEEDKNNYLAQTVAKYIAAQVMPDSAAHQFVLRWLDNLNVGLDFRITRPFIEVLKVDIMDSSATWRPLGLMGTGSIQLFILLLRIAIAIQDRKKVIIFVEEPEQNLHPALQSLLAEMFLDAIKISGNNIQFIVETHSEYMVRRTQVIVSRMIRGGTCDIDTINNDIKVYYFPENDIPYSMEYRNTGQFEHQFGPGFFDEAGKNYRALLEQNL